MIKKNASASATPKVAVKPISKAAPAAASKPASKAVVRTTPKPKPAGKSDSTPRAKPAPKAAAGVDKKATPPIAHAPTKPAAKQPEATVSPATRAAGVEPVKPPAPARANGAATTKPGPDGKERPRKSKLVRDSFTMPEAEYAALGEVKKACLKAGYEVKKSELLRVGVALIRKMDIVALKDVLAALPPLKAGRPKKS